MIFLANKFCNFFQFWVSCPFRTFLIDVGLCVIGQGQYVTRLVISFRNIAEVFFVINRNSGISLIEPISISSWRENVFERTQVQAVTVKIVYDIVFITLTPALASS